MLEMNFSSEGRQETSGQALFKDHAEPHTQMVLGGAQQRHTVPSLGTFIFHTPPFALLSSSLRQRTTFKVSLHDGGVVLFAFSLTIADTKHKSTQAFSSKYSPALWLGTKAEEWKRQGMEMREGATWNRLWWGWGCVQGYKALILKEVVPRVSLIRWGWTADATALQVGRPIHSKAYS